MRSLAAALFATSLLATFPGPVVSAAARPHASDDCSGSFDIGSGVEEPARWAPRRDSRQARAVITSRDGKVDLLLTPTGVAFQLSDRKMRSIERELRDDENGADDGTLGNAIRTAVLAGVRVLLKHSAECAVRDLRDVDYRDGELVFVTRSGGRVFDHLQVNDRDLVAAFSEREARAFVQEFRRLQAAGR